LGLARGSGRAIAHPVPEDKRSPSLIDDDSVVFQIELDAPLLERIRSEDDLVRKTEVKPKAPRGVRG